MSKNRQNERNNFLDYFFANQATDYRARGRVNLPYVLCNFSKMKPYKKKKTTTPLSQGPPHKLSADQQQEVLQILTGN